MKQMKSIGEVLSQTFAPKTPAPEMHPVHNVYDGKFNSFTGRKIDLIEPTPEMICIDDIAHALSNICRFGGHTRQFYSVAQHSVLVCAVVPDHLKQVALLHDAAEAYTGDIIKPLKVMIESVIEPIESRFALAIFQKYRINPIHLLDIKKADKYAISLEHECFMKGNSEPFIKVMREHNLIIDKQHVWPSQVAESIFLEFFKYHFC
jgi:hypothetical protein